MRKLDHRFCAWRNRNHYALTRRPVIAATRASPCDPNPGAKQDDQHKIANKAPGKLPHGFRIAAAHRKL